LGVVVPVLPVAPVVPVLVPLVPGAAFDCPLRLCPKLDASVELGPDVEPLVLDPAGPPPPRIFTFAFKSSMRGSYQNSHVSYVVCWFGVRIELPLRLVPTP
jgi:hypothetical protein